MSRVYPAKARRIALSKSKRGLKSIGHGTGLYAVKLTFVIARSVITRSIGGSAMAGLAEATPATGLPVAGRVFN